MSKYYSNTDFPPSSKGSKPKKKNPWITAIKVFCWCVGVLVVLAGIAVWIISYYVSSSHITHIIEEETSKYLKADLKIGKLDYKLFSTYPWLQFEIDSLTLVSKSLDGVQPSILDSLPPDPDFLASVVMVKGQVNLHSLMHKKINLRGIEIEQPKINIVMVNDSVNNFNIAPPLPKHTKVPKIDISEIKIIPPLNLDFFSLKNDIEAKVDLESFLLAQSEKNNYQIGFNGLVSGRYQDYSLPSQLPLKFNTGVKLDLPSFSVNLDNLTLALAGLAIDAKGMVSVNKKGVDFQNADLNLRIDDIFALLTYLPQQILDLIQLPEGLAGILPVNLNLSLMSPYHFEPDKFNMDNFEDINLQDLPYISAIFKVSDANLSFSPPHGKKVVADDIYLEAACELNPGFIEDTALAINELRMHGEGIEIDGRAELSNLLGEEQSLNCIFRFDTPLAQSLSYLMPNSGFNVAGLLKGKIVFSGTAINFGKNGLNDLQLKGDLLCHNLSVNSSSVGKLKIRNLKSDYDARIPSYPLDNYQGTRLAFDFNADSISSLNSGMALMFSDLKLSIDAMDTVSGNPDPSGDILVKLGNFSFKDGATSFNSNNISLNARGKLNSTPASGNYNTVSSTTPGDDALIASRVSHTPLVLEYSGGGMLQTAMNLLTLDADMSIDKGEFNTPDYLYPIKFAAVGASSNLNNIEFTAGNISIGNTAFSMGGVFKGLKPFMTSYNATPLEASADINFSDVNINQLAWGFYGAQLAQGLSKDSVFFLPEMTPFTAADSVCVAIPRNINANIRLKSETAEYMQYKFSPLSTQIIVKNGVATLDKLTVGTPYCTAIVDWTYSTSSLDNIFMNLKAKVKDFSFRPFYKVFPSLTARTPEIEDFTGIINANIDCNFLMYPDMFMNSESLKAKFDIAGTDMKFARQGRIEKITHLMMIEGDEPIRIQNMEITGGFHDNLLQINPFKVRFDDYQLGIGGINNTAGDMYYHLALEKSPFHVPFGVSLSGKFKHPEVRLGGTHINDYKAEMVSMDPVKKLNVNIMAYLKHGWLIFVQEAAKYEGGLRE